MGGGGVALCPVSVPDPPIPHINVSIQDVFRWFTAKSSLPPSYGCLMEGVNQKPFCALA